MENNLEMKNSKDNREEPQCEGVNNDAEKQKGICFIKRSNFSKDTSFMNL